MTQQLIVFTDLDGTLLDRDSYSFAAASDALQEIHKQNIPLVLNSSKTCTEIQTLRRSMENTHPFVVENGAAVIIPAGYFDIEKLEDGGQLEPLENSTSEMLLIKRFGNSYQQITTVLTAARNAGFRFTSFNDLTVKQLADLTGLNESAAIAAKQRMGTEPLLFEGGQKQRADFTAFLSAANLRLLEGGRFLHVMGEYDKAAGVSWLLDAYAKKFTGKTLCSIALGDSHNDEAMLNIVDVPVVIQSSHSAGIVLQHPDRAIFSNAAGPTGWNAVMSELLGQQPGNHITNRRF